MQFSWLIDLLNNTRVQATLLLHAATKAINHLQLQFVLILSVFLTMRPSDVHPTFCWLLVVLGLKLLSKRSRSDVRVGWRSAQVPPALWWRLESRTRRNRLQSWRSRCDSWSGKSRRALLSRVGWRCTCNMRDDSTGWTLWSWRNLKRRLKFINCDESFEWMSENEGWWRKYLFRKRLKS